MAELTYSERTERWDIFEVSCPGLTEGNPFTGYTVRGIFKGAEETVTADGFYDGNGIYRVRFMPSFAGPYTFEINGSFSRESFRGAFEVLPAQRANHGPVRVANQYHFAYEDGTPYYSIGTTCYVWELQSAELQ
ncbi:MAG: DUF5060 domain-containing protein, partial [Treponema sp.]|nr:DUF5060 domain-containing protein [Treponema sp.]